MTTDDFLRRQIIPLAYRQLPAGELFARVADNDPEAFVALVCLKYSLVEGVCRQVLGPAGPSEDVALEAFVQLWRQRARVRDADRVDGWLTRTARNLARKLVRDQARGRAAGRAWRERANGASASPDRAAIQSEMVRRVRRAVAEQSDDDQRVLHTSEHAGGDAQAAAALGLSVSTYRVRLHRARQRLRDLLKKYGVAPAAGAVGLLAGLRDRAMSAIAGRWASNFGRLQLAGLAAVCLAGLVGVAVWATQPAEPIPVSDPAPRASAHAPAPLSNPVEETLPEQNLRLLRTVVGPKVSEALRPLAPAGSTFTVLEADAYDSRAKYVLEARTAGPPGEAGRVSRVAFYYDTYLRNTFVYFDPAGAGTWKWVDLDRPVVLFAMEKPRWEWSIKLAPLTKAVQAFEEFPKDPRGYPEAERRFIAMRDRAKQYQGTWYRDGDPRAAARVEVEDSLVMRFFRPGDKAPFLEVDHAWRAELGSRAKVSKNEDGYLAAYGIYLSADGQVLTFDSPERPWHRVPKGK